MRVAVAGKCAGALLGAVLAVGVAPHQASADAGPTLVVAVNGDDTAAGTLDHPLRTIQKAVDKAKPGDVIAVRGGTYALTDNITIATSGTASQPITLAAYQGERVVVDGEQLPASHTPVIDLPARRGGGVFSADAVARKHHAAVFVAVRRRRAVRNRPCLVGLQSEAHQGQEEADVGVDFEAYGHPSRAGHHPDRGRAPEVILEAVNGTGREVQVDIVIRMEMHDLALSGAQRPPRAAARPGLREVRPARQLRHGTQGQRHAPIMTSSPSGHQGLRKP